MQNILIRDNSADFYYFNDGANCTYYFTLKIRYYTLFIGKRKTEIRKTQ